MKLFGQFSALILSSLLLSTSVFGGVGLGGTTGRTLELLQAVSGEKVALSFDGATGIPETNDPKLDIPEKDYTYFLSAIEKAELTHQSIDVLPVPTGDGTTFRYFQLKYTVYSEINVIGMTFEEVPAPK